MPDTSTPAPASVASLDAAAGRHPLRPAHLAVVVLVTAAALVGTVLVLASAQPSTQQVDLATGGQPHASSAADTAPAPAAATATPATTSPSAAPAAPATPATQTAAGEVVVHVAGKVRRPGVVRLPAGSRVIDAVEAAGGALPKARLASVNLARVLADGEQVRVGIDATQPQQDDATLPTGTTGPLSGGASDAGIVDLNVASAVELEELPGIGPVLAGRIVAYRDQNGPFRSVDQLIEVPGIGPAVLSGLADRARV